MENIFKFAYLGKAYRTREGRKAIYIKNTYTAGHRYVLVVEDDNRNPRFSYFDSKGHYDYDEHPYDIISEWQEEPVNLSSVENGRLILECIKREIYISKKNNVSEQELDALAEQYAEKNYCSYACHDDDTDDWYDCNDKSTAYKAYKAGYNLQ